MKRAITIFLIILVVVGIFLTGAWLISRRTAVKNSAPAPTFRDFITGDSGKGDTLTPNNGDLSSVFVDDNLGNTDTVGVVDTTPGTQVAQFTNGGTSPSGGSSGAGNTQGTSGNGITTTTSPNGTTTTTTPGTVPGTVIITTTTPNGTTTTTTTSIDPTTQPPSTAPATTPGPACGDADLNIQFTANELAKLQVLQNRFYAIAQSLHSDADVATELGNHDNFLAKVTNTESLYLFCDQIVTTQGAGAITNPAYKKHIPTPFWHSNGILGTDNELFIATDGPYDGTLRIGIPMPNGFPGNQDPGDITTNPDDLLFTPNNVKLVLRSLERSLRLNLW